MNTFLTIGVIILCFGISSQEKLVGSSQLTLSNGEGNVIIYPIDYYDLYFSKPPRGLDVTGILVSAVDIDSLIAIFQKYNETFNNRWIVLISSKIVMKQVIDYINTTFTEQSKGILAVIMSDTIDSGYYFTQYVPLFSIDNAMFVELINHYSFLNEDDNYFASIKTAGRSSLFPTTYLMTVVIICAILSLLSVTIWHLMVYKFYRSYVISIQKILTVLPYIKSILCTLMVYYIYCVSQEQNGSMNLSKIYLDTIISTLFSIFRTILWFVLILVSNGWQLYKYSLTREEMRKYIGIYIFIYLSVCIDQIIDVIIDETVFRFSGSEIKNTIAMIVLATYIVIKSKASLKFLRNKMRYANMLAPEYLPALKLKYNLLKRHLLIGLLYSLLYISVMIVQKWVFLPYFSPAVASVNYGAIDLIILMLYLLNFRPRKLPQHFTVDYGSEELNTQGEIYSCKLLIQKDFNFTSAASTTYFTKQEMNMIKKEHAPVVVLQPVFDSSRQNSMNVINNSEGVSNSHQLRQKMLENLSVGFYHNI